MTSGKFSTSGRVYGIDDDDDDDRLRQVTSLRSDRRRREIVDVDTSSDEGKGDTARFQVTTTASQRSPHNHATSGTQLPKFTLPDGRLIDSKNTLQSYDTLTARVVVPVTSNHKRSTSSTHVTGALNDSAPTTARTQLEANDDIHASSTVSNRKPPKVVNEGSVIHAVAVRSFAVATAEAIDGSFISTRKPCYIKRSFVFVLLGSLCVTMLAGAIVGVYCGTGNCTARETRENPDETLLPSKEETLSKYINNVTLSKRQLNVNGTEAEDKALNYLINRDTWLYIDTNWLPLQSLTTKTEQHVKVCQRFALYTLWFQQPINPNNGEGEKTWISQNNWLLDENECNWFGISCADDNVITGIDFYDDASLNLNKDNNFTGTLPADLGLLSSLRMFHFSFNNIIGTLPESIGRWSDLTYFNISSNKIYGTLPESISSWTNLMYFDVSSLDLLGSLPPWIGQWKNILYFLIDYNAFSGNLPESIGSWVSLTNFSVAGNEFVGTVPLSIGNWKSIQQAYFDQNNFDGTIPDLICQNKDLYLVTDCTAQNSCTNDCVPS